MTDFEGFGPDETQKRLKELMTANTRTMRIIKASHKVLELQRDLLNKQDKEMIALLKELAGVLRHDGIEPGIYARQIEETDLTEMLPTYVTLIEKHSEELKNG